MTAPFLSPGFRATDSDDNPLAGGYINFYAAGTTTPKAVYSDADLSTSLGTTVNLNSAGAPVSGSNTPVLIYPGLGDYKILYYDADDTLIFEFDDYPGAVAEAAEVTTGLPKIPVDSKTTAYTVVVGDRANLINCNPTGGSFAITLPSAVTVGDDFLVGFKHNGTANAVTIVATGSQVIRFQGNRAAFSLVGQGEVMWLLSDGSDWNCVGYVPPFRKATDPYFIVLDRLTAPPANPDAGARYLLNGVPTGAFATQGFTENDIGEADGNGSWIKHTPAEGWLAFDADEKVSLIFKDGAWENFQIDPGESTLKTLIVQDQKSSNTDGGTPTTAAWTTAVLNTSVINTITDSSLASNEITLPAGRYRVKARKVFSTNHECRIRFKTADSSDVIILSESVHSGHSVSTQSQNTLMALTAMLDGEFVITESTDFVLQYYVAVNQHTTATQGLGIPSNISGAVEIYATVIIEDLASLQGPKGDEGDPGPDGLDAAYAYQFNTATSGDPGTGKILVNNATPASVTQIAVHQTDANGADLTAVIASWDNSTSTTSKARLRFHKEGTPSNFFEFLITGTGTDAGSYWTFPVSYVSHGGTISNGNDIAILVVQTGDIGDPGTTVPDISGLTAIDAVDRAADLFPVYDNSASSTKKATLDQMADSIVLDDASAVVGDSDAFWWDGSSAAKVHKLNRILVGEASLGGRSAPMSPEPWLEALWDGSVQNSQLASVNTIGLIGLTGAARASDHADAFGSGSFGTIGGSFWAINDDDTYESYVWASYHHFNRDDNAIGGGYAAEFGVANFHDEVDVDPYNKFPTGYHGCIVLQSGNDYPTGEDARTPNAAPFAAVIANNGAQFLKGFIFHDDALDTSVGAGGNGVAIEFAALQSMRWLSAAATTAAEMWANSSSFKFAAITGATISWGHVSSLNAYTERMFLSSAGVLNISNTGPAYTLYTNSTNTRTMSVGVVDQFNAVIDWGAASTLLLKRNNVTLVTIFDGLLAGAGLTDQGIGTINVAGSYFVDDVRVVTNRKTGWGLATGTETRTTFATGSVTLPQLAERVAALIADLHQTAGHGLIGT